MFTLKCFDGTKHSGKYLSEMFSTNENVYGECVSIKWCTECGAVVGDRMVDDRVMGRVFNMEFPAVAKLREIV